MKKPAAPAPAPRAAALAQSADQFSTGATATWQRIAGNSSRLATARRVAAPLAPPAAPRPSRLVEQAPEAAPLVAPAEKPETIRQVGWREVDRAVSVRTERKYNLFGFRFGPKVPAFETEKVKLPVYQETDREKRYYAVVSQDDVERIKQHGFQGEAGDKGVTPKTVAQFNSRGHVFFFSSEAAARRYGRKRIDGECAIVEFVLPEYQAFTSECAEEDKLPVTRLLHTTESIAAQNILSTKALA